jgi:hypothetical protein
VESDDMQDKLLWWDLIGGDVALGAVCLSDLTALSLAYRMKLSAKE